MPQTKKPSKLKSVFVVLAGAVLFIGFAAMVTLMAPISSIKLERNRDGSVDAEVRQYALWVLPFRSMTVHHVQTASDRVDHPERSSIVGPTRDQDPSTGRTLQPEAVGNLILTGADGTISTYTSPENLRDAVRDVNDFLHGQATHLELWEVANWTFSIIIPAVVALPGLLLLLGLVVDIFRWTFLKRNEREQKYINTNKLDHNT